MNVNSHTEQSILLVEDSKDDYEATMRAFKKAKLNNTVFWTKSGQKALDFLKAEGAYKGAIEEKPGLILLDLNMPGMDGRQTLRVIKEDKKLRGIPVVILTTSNNEQDVENCYQMGANSYIQKPISFEGLTEAIRQLKEYWFEIALLPKKSYDSKAYE